MTGTAQDPHDMTTPQAIAEELNPLARTAVEPITDSLIAEG
jgi:hypothetical protein